MSSGKDEIMQFGLPKAYIIYFLKEIVLKPTLDIEHVEIRLCLMDIVIFFNQGYVILVYLRVDDRVKGLLVFLGRHASSNGFTTIFGKNGMKEGGAERENLSHNKI